MHTQLLRLAEVVKLTRLSKASIYARMKAQDFPAPLRLGPRMVAWRASDVDEWLASRPSAMPKSPPGQP